MNIAPVSGQAEQGSGRSGVEAAAALEEVARPMGGEGGRQETPSVERRDARARKLACPANGCALPRFDVLGMRSRDRFAQVALAGPQFVIRKITS